MHIKKKISDFQQNRTYFFNTPLDILSMKEVMNIAEYSMHSKTKVQQVVINVAKFINMRKDQKLRESVCESDLINVDGMGILLGLKIFRYPIKERINGTDLMENLIRLWEDKNFKPFFLGAKQETLEAAITNIKKKHPKINIAGYHHGYFTQDQERDVCRYIEDSKADCLFVAISSPKKEIIMNKLKKNYSIPFVMGVGGSIDVIAGKVKRAPLWMQKYGLEWFFRLIQEPKRMWKRYLITNVAYVLFLIKNWKNSRKRI